MIKNKFFLVLTGLLSLFIIACKPGWRDKFLEVTELKNEDVKIIFVPDKDTEEQLTLSCKVRIMPGFTIIRKPAEIEQ